MLQAAQRFSHMMGNLSLKTEHLVVFITSDQDFAATITDLKARNFRVEVIYHAPIASSKPVSIINTADQSYDWLPFLQEHLKMPLSLDPYDDSVKQAGTGVLGNAATPNKWSQTHGGAPARPSSSRNGNASAQPQTQVPAATQPRQVMPAPATASQGLLVMLSGWASADGWSIEEQCKLLLSAYVSEEAAAAATVHLSNDSKSAVLDFSSLGSRSQQLATTAAMLLDRVNCRDFIVFAKIVLCTDAALIGKFSSFQSNSQSSAPLNSKGFSPSAASSNQAPSLPGSSEQHAHQGYHGLSTPSFWQQQQPNHQNNKPQGPSTVNRQPGPRKTCPKHVAGSAKGTNRQEMSQEPSGQQSASTAHKTTLPSSADTANTGVSSSMSSSKNIPGSSKYSAADAGRLQNVKASNADKAAPANDDQSDSESSGDAFTAAFGLGGGANGFAGHAQWGFDSAIGAPVTFLPEQCEQLQVQWNQLQCVDEAEQAHSEHRCQLNRLSEHSAQCPHHKLVVVPDNLLHSCLQAVASTDFIT